jgi:hypothetical protein
VREFPGRYLHGEDKKGRTKALPIKWEKVTDVKKDAFVKSRVHPSIPQGGRIMKIVSVKFPFMVRYRTMSGKA